VIAFRRWYDGGPGDDVVVIANFSAQAATNYCLGFPRAGEWKLRFNGDWTGYSPIFTGAFQGDVVAVDEHYDCYPAKAVLEVAPYSVLIYSQDKQS
jgi:1,4-alpha-glucan branching enzyme